MEGPLLSPVNAWFVGSFIMHFESIIWKLEFNSKMGKVVKINEAEREGNVCNTLTAFDNKLIIKS
jgi:hypothetical protein